MPTTLITGTSRGIGKALAEHLLARGDTVVGVSRGTASIEHANYHHHVADVSDPASVVRVFAGYRRIDRLINNAGIASMNHTLLTPMTKVREIFATNVMGPYACVQEAMRKGCTRVVNFSTVAVPYDLPGEAAYAASKAAIESLTRIWAREFPTATVNAVGPTPIDTALLRGVPAAKLEALVARQAIPRMGTVDDVINVVDFFLSPASSFITGQTIYLGGVC